ncbi:hypothetical protein NE237_015817 [Protea cynaroides]|uniref:Uncharacterized protein n=1 Tax=Protea cynaroides TaxID=273540 RepID=A0A9Q0GLX7_9MAGN|nr:hypothetical protein NE237_000029 [Protea cynaroides]KAJ4969116.1 hypothetical protein NE237_015817 [Protea cynaroides]
MALSLSGSDNANPLTPALLVQLGISLSPGQQYLIHSSNFSHVWKRQQRKKKGDRRTEVKQLTFLSFQYGLRLHLNKNLNLDLPQKFGSATHLEYVTWSDLAWLMKDLVFMTIFLKPKEELSSHRARLL